MKKILFVLFVVLTQTSIGQTIEVKPSLGLVFGGFNKLNERPVRTSILYYPKLLAFDLGYCVDIIYKHHKFNIASSPVGNNFGGILRTIDNNQIEGIFNFSRTINQLLLGYQYYNVIPSKSKRIKFNYAFGLGYGFNSNEFNYQDSMVRYFAGGSAGRGGYFYAFEGEVKRVGGSLYIMPEIGMDLYSKKKKKKVLSLSLYYNMGLQVAAYASLKLQYGQLGTSYFVEENVGLYARGTAYGFKLSVPISIKIPNKKNKY